MGKLFFIWTAIALMLLLIIFLPIILNVTSYFDIQQKKFYFSVRLYRCIRLSGGYITTYPGGISVHTSKHKARLIRLQDRKREQKKIAFYKTFNLIKAEIILDSDCEYLAGITILHVLASILPIKNKEKLQSFFWIENTNTIKTSLYAGVYFNLWMLLRVFIKYIKETIKNYATK